MLPFQIAELARAANRQANDIVRGLREGWMEREIVTSMQIGRPFQERQKLYREGIARIAARVKAAFLSLDRQGGRPADPADLGRARVGGGARVPRRDPHRLIAGARGPAARAGAVTSGRLAMTPAEVAKVLAKVQAFDRRTVVRGRHRGVARDPLQSRLIEALEAVTRHYATSADWLMPVHLVRLADEVCDDRRRMALQERAARALVAEQQAHPATHDRSVEVQQLIRELRGPVAGGQPGRVCATAQALA